jgi:signal peptidase
MAVISRRTAGTVLTGLLIVVVGSLVLGQLLGQPILFSYVETGSMAPALQPGDGFVAVPPALAGSIGQGDVVTFDAEEINGGDLVTHRVVGETESGYVTKGDANAFTDQDGREPPVTPAQVKAVALQVNGNVVKIPGLGLAVLVVQDLLEGLQRQLAVLFGTRQLLGTQGLAYLLLAVGALAYLGSAILERRDAGRRSRRRPKPSRPVYDTRTIVVVLTIGVVVLTTASMVAPSGPQTVDIVSSSSDSPRRNVVGAGTTENISYAVRNRGFLPAVGFLEPRSAQLDIDRSAVLVRPGERVNVSVAVTAPPETGFYRYTLTRNWYLAVLPASTIRDLYMLHPWAPIVVIDILFAVGFGTLAAGLVGFGRYRVREQSTSTIDRLRERIDDWFG